MHSLRSWIHAAALSSLCFPFGPIDFKRTLCVCGFMRLHGALFIFPFDPLILNAFSAFVDSFVCFSATISMRDEDEGDESSNPQTSQDFKTCKK